MGFSALLCASVVKMNHKGTEGPGNYPYRVFLVTILNLTRHGTRRY